MSEPFMTITPRNKTYIGFNAGGMNIRIIQDDGIEYNPHIKFSEVEMENGVKRFFNNSGKSDSFTVTCIFDSTETIKLTKEYVGYTSLFEDEEIISAERWKDTVFELLFFGERSDGETSAIYSVDVPVIEVLDAFIRRGEVFYITTRAIGIDSKELWKITENKERTQSYDDKYTVWSLTFSKSVSYTYATFKENSAGVSNAIKKYEKKKKAKADAKKKKTAKYKLQHECKASNLKYSKKKKVVTCVKYMQQILINKKFLKKSQKDGWYGKTTKNALKQFQKKYKEKYKCKTDGNVDKNTFKALYSV